MTFATREMKNHGLNVFTSYWNIQQKHTNLIFITKQAIQMGIYSLPLLEGEQILIAFANTPQDVVVRYVVYTKKSIH